MGSYSKITGSRKPSSWTTSSAYSEYKKEAVVYGVPVRSRQDYTTLCRDIFDAIADAIIYDHFEWTFDKGKVAIRKYIPTTPNIDWVETRKKGKIVPYSSLSTNGFAFMIALLKGPRTKYSKYKASEEFKDKLKNHIHKCATDPFVSDYTVPILDPEKIKKEKDYWDNMKYLSTKYKKSNQNVC